MKLFHFCAEYNESPGVKHVFDGTCTFDGDEFDRRFYDQLKARIADSMKPVRPADRVVIRSLTVIAER